MFSTPDQTPGEHEEQELSLRSLSEAFAEALARGSDEQKEEPAQPSEEPDAETAQSQATPPSEPDADLIEKVSPDEDDGCPISPRTILEAMLFMGDPENRPLDCERAAELMRGVEPGDIPAIIEELNGSYQVNGCPYRVRSEGAGYRLVLDERHHRVRDKFYGRIREARLSQAAIDVLAIVAYRQPIGADEVSRLRDKPCHHILAQLVRRRLLCVERPPGKKRKAFYRTTDRFLDLFELESLDDLPESAELNRS
jgi:segregation and condensation protein B